MSKRSEPWDDIETILDEVRVEEEVMLAVLEALGQLDDLTVDEFWWDELLVGDSPMEERPRATLQ